MPCRWDGDAVSRFNESISYLRNIHVRMYMYIYIRITERDIYIVYIHI